MVKEDNINKNKKLSFNNKLINMLEKNNEEITSVGFKEELTTKNEHYHAKREIPGRPGSHEIVLCTRRFTN